MEIKFKTGDLDVHEQQVITEGFLRHTNNHEAPHYDKSNLNWLAYNEEGNIVGALTAYFLWDWIYVDELWVDESARGTGLGKRLMEQAEDYARANKHSGIWLWTQSWQAEEFYKHLGYEEFSRFPNFPKGHERIGFRKMIAAC